MASIRFIFALLGMTLLGSCDLIASLPVITPEPIIFPSNSPTKVMMARITQRRVRMEDTRFSVTCEVSLRLTPNRATTPVIVRAIQGSGTSWACNLPAGFAIRPNQVVQAQWRVHSGATKLAESERQDQVLDCRNPTRELTTLQQAIVGRFSTMRHDQIISARFVPIHGFTSYQGMGVAFVRAPPLGNLVARATEAMSNFGAPERDTPDILLFRPTGNSVTDADGPDNPYQLVGWGYAATITGAEPRGPSGAPANNSRPIQRRPGLRCVPHHEWFIHSSGRHYADGTFLPRPTPPVDPDNDRLVHAPDASFRPALWFVLFFVNEGAPPTIGMVNSGGTALPGITAPANSFYYPTAYD